MSFPDLNVFWGRSKSPSPKGQAVPNAMFSSNWTPNISVKHNKYQRSVDEALFPKPKHAPFPGQMSNLRDGYIGHTPRGSYSPTRRSKHLIKNPLLTNTSSLQNPSKNLLQSPSQNLRNPLGVHPVAPVSRPQAQRGALDAQIASDFKASDLKSQRFISSRCGFSCDFYSLFPSLRGDSAAISQISLRFQIAATLPRFKMAAICDLASKGRGGKPTFTGKRFCEDLGFSEPRLSISLSRLELPHKNPSFRRLYPAS